MSKEQLDAIKEKLLYEENSHPRQSALGDYLKEPERCANMMIAFATHKGLQPNATPSEVDNFMDSLDEEDIDIDTRNADKRGG